MDKIFNKTFWKFLAGFLVAVAISLFLIIVVGTFVEISADTENAQEDCFLFC